MSVDQEREPTRIFITGACDGLDELVAALAEHRRGRAGGPPGA